MHSMSLVNDPHKCVYRKMILKELVLLKKLRMNETYLTQKTEKLKGITCSYLSFQSIKMRCNFLLLQILDLFMLMKLQ